MEQPTRHAMPNELRQVFETLSDQLSGLHVTWKVYRQLFGTDEERVNVLNQVAPGAMFVVHRVLRDAVYLGLDRLTDRAEVMGNKNLSFGLLVEQLDRPEYSLLHQKLERALCHLVSLCDSLRTEHRNKRIAHNDLARSLAPTFSCPARSDTEEAFEACRSFMNLIYSYFDGSTMAYEYSFMLGGGDSLIYHLKEGMWLKDLRRKVYMGQLAGDDLVNEIKTRPSLKPGQWDR
jgi:hypothetical protein